MELFLTGPPNQNLCQFAIDKSMGTDVYCEYCCSRSEVFAWKFSFTHAVRQTDVNIL